MLPSTLHSLKQKISARAIQTLGFDDCRFTDPFLDGQLEEYKTWLKENRHGEMTYLKEHLKFKENPGLLLSGVKSAIVLIKNYKNISIRQITAEFKIARYAVGQDYHAVIKDRLKKLMEFMKAEYPLIQCYAGVDSSAIAERSLALKAGIGFRGKNTMVIKPGLGSYFFIAVILTNHSFENDSHLNWNCGSCRLCLDACPTGALAPAYTLDANKCISYLTIEKKEPLSVDEIKKTQGWIFGCDICQEVCPYNHGQTPLTDWKEFQPQSGVGFDFFQNNPLELSENNIPKNTPLYRSRKRVVPNVNLAKSVSIPLFPSINKS